MVKVKKSGILKKLGGGDGGRKNWKERYFVLEENLYYYDNEDVYKSGGKPLGKVNLNAYFASKSDNEADFEFTGTCIYFQLLGSNGRKIF